MVEKLQGVYRGSSKIAVGEIAVGVILLTEHTNSKNETGLAVILFGGKRKLYDLPTEIVKETSVRKKAVRILKKTSAQLFNISSKTLGEKYSCFDERSRQTRQIYVVKVNHENGIQKEYYYQNRLEMDNTSDFPGMNYFYIADLKKGFPVPGAVKCKDADGKTDTLDESLVTCITNIKNLEDMPAVNLKFTEKAYSEKYKKEFCQYSS